MNPEFVLKFENFSYRGEPIGVLYEIPLKLASYAGFNNVLSRDKKYIMDVLQHYLPQEGIVFDTVTLEFKQFMVMIMNYNHKDKRWELG